MSERLATPRLIGMMGGLWLWAAQFTVIYAFTALACARGFGEAEALGMNLVRLVIVIVTLACLVADGFIFAGAYAARRATRPEPFTSGDFMVQTMTMTIAALAFLAMLYNALPALIVPICKS